jgi:hypothetical protein
MKGQLPINPKWLEIIGFILLFLSLLSLQKVLPVQIPYISTYSVDFLGLSLILLGWGIFGFFGIIGGVILAILAILGGII